MGIRIDTTYDHEDLAESPETILYGSKLGEQAPDVGEWLTIESVEVFPIDKKRMESTHLLAKLDVTFRISLHKMGGVAPKNDDVWKRANGTYWVVKMVDVLSFGNEFRVHSQKSTLR